MYQKEIESSREAAAARNVLLKKMAAERLKNVAAKKKAKGG